MTTSRSGGTSRVMALFLALVVAIVLGGAVVALSGRNPFPVFFELVKGSVWDRQLEVTLARSVPLVGMALAAAVALRAGVINLGGDGQLLVGALVAVVIALYLPAPGPIRITVALIAAMCAGGAYASLAAVLETALGVPFLIASLLLSYIARGITSYLVRYPLRDISTGQPETHRIVRDARLPDNLLDLPISMGFVLMALVAVALVVNDGRGVNGFEWRMRGINAQFVRYSGIKLQRQTVTIAFASGALAGLVGALLVLGEQYRFTDGALLAAGFTWSGLMAAILAMGNPIAAIVAGVFFAALQVGGFSMERVLGLPNVLTQILQALIILCLAARVAFARKA